MGRFWSKGFRAASCVCLVAGSVLTARAQRYLGSINGEAVDSTGAKVPGATVRVEDATTHFKTAAVTNGSGAYSLPALNPGTYTVTVTAPSFKSETRTNLVLTAGQVAEADFTLTPGAANETVQVTSENSLLDPASANIATTLSTQEVTDLPNEGRNPFVMAVDAAGVQSTYFQTKSSQFTNPYSGVAVQIAADGSSGHNRLTLDGIPDDPAERLSGASYLGFVPSPEAVQEVKVQTSIFDAQVGHGNGTVTNTVVRSGTDHLHGSAYYVFQNTYLNANTYEKVPNQNLCYPGSAGCTNTIVPTRRNNDQVSQTGFVVDGPVFIPKLYDGRDKTYFMVAFERYATHTALNYTSRVPTAAELGGNFGGLCPGGFTAAGLCQSGVQLYDPLSPLDANGNRTVYFANNNIASRLNNAGVALASLLPVGAPGTETSTSNYISTQTSYPSTYPSFIARFDQAIRSKDKLNAIFFRSGLTQSYPFEGFSHGIPPLQGTGGYGYTVYRNNRGGSLDEIHEFNSSLVLDSRFGLIFHPFGLTYPGNQNYNLAALNISGTGLPYSSFPGVQINTAGYAGLSPGAGGQISENTFGALEEILSKTWGRHSVRFGFEGNLIRYNVQAPQSGFGSSTTSLQGGFVFDNTFTEQNTRNSVNAQASSGDPIAALLLGTPTSVNYFINIAYALQQKYMAPFVQDDWRVSDRLTMNLGLRYDYESPFTERHNRMNAGFCNTCVNPLQSTVGGTTLNGGTLNGGETFVSAGNRFEYPRDLNNIQPRIGAAYQATPTTVARAGFGIIYFNTLESPSVGGFTAATNESYSAGVSTPVYGLNNPFPNGVNLPTGNSLATLTQVGQNITFFDPNHVQPKSAQYSASLQQQFPGSLALQIAYVGTRPTRLEVNHNINVLPLQYYNQGAAQVTYLNTAVPNPMAGKLPGSPVNNLNAATVPRNLLLLPYPEFGSITENDSSIGSAPYNSLQVQVNRPMKNHFSLQANFTWDKLMLRNGFFSNGGGGAGDNASIASGHLYSVQDSAPTILANIFGTYELPKFEGARAWMRLLLGGWEVNGVMRAENGPLIAVPSNVNVIGNTRQPNPTYTRYINTCYENTSGVPVATTATAPGCDARSPNPAYIQRLSYTAQNNSVYLNIRQRIYPLVDTSLFKKFFLTEKTSFEIRGEFFNVLNTPEFGAPSTSIGGASFGSVASSTGVLTQSNDPRIGQLTARINF
jgi:hypothetical protein